MSKPKHFENALQFEIFILECAIRDRETFIDACLSPWWEQKDAPIQKAIDESRLKITAMKAKRDKLVEKQGAPPPDA